MSRKNAVAEHDQARTSDAAMEPAQMSRKNRLTANSSSGSPSSRNGAGSDEPEELASQVRADHDHAAAMEPAQMSRKNVVAFTDTVFDVGAAMEPAQMSRKN